MITASCKSLILSTSCCVFRVLSATSFTPPFLFHTPLATEPNCPDPRCWCDLRTKYVFVNHLRHAKDSYYHFSQGRIRNFERGKAISWLQGIRFKMGPLCREEVKTCRNSPNASILYSLKFTATDLVDIVHPQLCIEFIFTSSWNLVGVQISFILNLKTSTLIG